MESPSVNAQRLLRRSSAPRGRVHSVVAVLATAAVLMSGCANPSATTEADGTIVARSTAADPWAVTDLVTYVGGKPGAADTTLEPVRIGWVNQQGGSLEFPDATAGAQAAVEYVNDQLGGIDGHPLELSTCYVVDNEQEGNACGLRMANDDAVKAVLFGTLMTGGNSLQAVLQGSKPILMANSISPPDATGKNVFIFNGNPSTIFGGMGTYLRDQGVKSVAAIYPQDAQSAAGVAQLGAVLKGLGIELKAVGFDPASTNLTAAAVAANVQHADAVVPLVSSPAHCVAAAKALRSLAVSAPVVSSGSFCFSEAVARGLGGDTPKWRQLVTQSNVADTALPDVKAYLGQSEKAGLSADAQTNSDATLAWGLVMTAARFLNGAGGVDATPETMARSAESFTGPMLLAGKTVKCASFPSQPGLCGAQSRVFEHTGADSFVAVSDWLEPSGL